MLIASIDIETTGLNPINHQILDFGCILFDTEQMELDVYSRPVFRKRIYWPEIVGEPIALRMNAKILEAMSYQDPKGVEEGWCTINYLASMFRSWLLMYMKADAQGRAKIHPAGKNFGAFDGQFLHQVPGWDKDIRMVHRSFDPAVLYFNPLTDLQLPDLKTCLQRAGLPTDCLHQAIGDAAAVVELLRVKFRDYPVQEARSDGLRLGAEQIG